MQWLPEAPSRSWWVCLKGRDSFSRIRTVRLGGIKVRHILRCLYIPKVWCSIPSRNALSSIKRILRWCSTQHTPPASGRNNATGPVNQCLGDDGGESAHTDRLQEGNKSNFHSLPIVHHLIGCCKVIESPSTSAVKNSHHILYVLRRVDTAQA